MTYSMTWATTADPNAFATIDVLRRRPVMDLTAALPFSLTPHTVVDLCCGAGQLSRLLAARWPKADVLAVDHSPAMLRWAADTPSRVRYQQADLGEWRPHWPVDLVISAGGLHHVGGHERLFPTCCNRSAPAASLPSPCPVRRLRPPIACCWKPLPTAPGRTGCTMSGQRRSGRKAPATVPRTIMTGWLPRAP